jgi:hypothetical protein
MSRNLDNLIAIWYPIHRCKSWKGGALYATSSQSSYLSKHMGAPVCCQLANFYSEIMPAVMT